MCYIVFVVVKNMEGKKQSRGVVVLQIIYKYINIDEIDFKANCFFFIFALARMGKN